MIGRFLAVTVNTYRETVRERVLYNLVLFAILMTLAGLLLGELSIWQDEKIIKDVGLASIELFGTCIAIFVGVSLVSKEIERRSLHPLLAKPVTRAEFLLGKFGGLSLTLLVNCTVMALGLYCTLWATGRALDGQLVKAVYATYLSLLVVVAVAMMFSTRSSSTLAGVFTVGIVVAGRFSDVIRNMKDVAPDTPAWLTQSLYYALPNFRTFDLKNQVVYGDAVSLGDLAWITGYAIAYAGVVVVVALASFQSRDFE